MGGRLFAPPRHRYPRTDRPQPTARSAASRHGSGPGWDDRSGGRALDRRGITIVIVEPIPVDQYRSVPVTCATSGAGFPGVAGGADQ